MVSTLLILAVAALALVFAYALLHNAHSGIRDGQDWAQKKHEVDVEIFQVLLDRNEEIELRRFLAPNQFAIFQRQRTRVALRLLQLVDENAGMLMELARLAKLKGDPALAHQAVDELIANAFELRLKLLLARICLYLKWLFPSWTVSLPAFDVRYEYLLKSLHVFTNAAA
jgi:hypothetical protein